MHNKKRKRNIMDNKNLINKAEKLIKIAEICSKVTMVLILTFLIFL
jgi:hypothetical protein